MVKRTSCKENTAYPALIIQVSVHNTHVKSEIDFADEDVLKSLMIWGKYPISPTNGTIGYNIVNAVPKSIHNHILNTLNFM